MSPSNNGPATGWVNAYYSFDPLDDAIPWNVLGRRVIARREPLRRVLLDPAVVAGLGDCYVDEVLFEAGLRHDRPASNLSVQEVRRLYRSLVEVVHDAVKHRGTSIGDAPFVDLAGRPGEHAEHLQVHGRDGRPSTRSRSTSYTRRYGARSMPIECQKS